MAKEKRGLGKVSARRVQYAINCTETSEECKNIILEHLQRTLARSPNGLLDYDELLHVLRELPKNFKKSRDYLIVYCALKDPKQLPFVA